MYVLQVLQQLMDHLLRPPFSVLDVPHLLLQTLHSSQSFGQSEFQVGRGRGQGIRVVMVLRGFCGSEVFQLRGFCSSPGGFSRSVFQQPVQVCTEAEDRGPDPASEPDRLTGSVKVLRSEVVTAQNR